MIPRTTASRPVRAGAGVASVTGLALLTACGAAGAPETSATSPAAGSGQSASAPGAAASPTADASGGTYADGTYTANGSYSTPESVETISVTVTLTDDVVTAVTVTGEPSRRESENYQGQFIGGIAEVTVGKRIDELDVSRVAGSSLTSGGFNAAIAEIMTQAKA